MFMLCQIQEVIMASYEDRWMSYISRPLAVIDTVRLDARGVRRTDLHFTDRRTDKIGQTDGRKG